MRILHQRSIWAILPEKLAEIEEAVSANPGLLMPRLAIGRGSSSRSRSYEIVEGVAVLPIEGILGKRADFFFIDTGTEQLGRDFSAALADPAVHAILLRVDSPGGQVDGTLEFARMVREARGIKPIVTLASSLMASGAYWIGSAADQVFSAGETTAVGSIGVIATHFDLSKLLEDFGVKVTHITAGRYKAVGSPFKPLDRFSEDVIQQRVNEIYGIFIDEVASNRRTSVERVLTDMADARIFVGQKALDAGLVDKFATEDQLISMLNQQRGQALIAPVAHTSKEESMDNITLTKEEFTAKLQAEFERGKGDSLAAIETAKTESARLERERITAIEEVGSSLPGHEALVQELKFDGKTTAADASQRILAAEKEKRARVVSDLRADAPKPAPAAEAPEKPAVAEASLPLEERCKLEWERTPALREEFPSLAAYTAFRKAEAAGKVRILTRREARSA